MKKFLFGLILFCLLAASAYAGGGGMTMAAPTIYGPLSWSGLWSWNVATETPVIPSNGAWGLSNHTASKKDSLVGVDSIMLLNHFPIPRTGLIAFNIYDTTGAADSIHFVCTVYGSDGKTPMLKRAIVDTIGGTQTNKTIILPINYTVPGSAITLQAFKWIAAKTAKIWRFELVRARTDLSASTSTLP